MEQKYHISMAKAERTKNWAKVAGGGGGKAAADKKHQKPHHLNSVLRTMGKWSYMSAHSPKRISQLVSSVFLISMFKLESTENSEQCQGLVPTPRRLIRIPWKRPGVLLKLDSLVQ